MKNKVDRALLTPLISKTFAHFLEGEANGFELQTGPAKRNDHVTINHHLRTLENHPEYQSIYKQLTQSIQTTHGFKKL